MKLNKILLEAAHRGIQMALDDFDDTLVGQQVGSIKNQNITKDYFEYQELLKRFKDFTLLDDGMRRFAELSIKLDIKYPVHTTEELKEIIKYTCARDKTLNLNWVDVSDIRSMVSLFHGSQFNGNISEWDVSNVTDMRNMFALSKFNGDISKWDVHNVKYMGAMFYYSSFNKDISKWDVSNVEDMQSMFANSKFNKPIGDWDVSSVRGMNGMFSGNEYFNQDISKWDVHMVKNMANMFSETNFNKPLNDWYVGNVENMAYMFNQGLFNQSLDKWDVSEVKNMRKMFCGSAFHQDISMWKCDALVEAEGMFDNYNNLPIEFVPKKLQHWEKKWLGLRESFDFNKINLTLDDFDDELVGQQVAIAKIDTHTSDYIRYQKLIKKFEEVIDKFQSGIMSKEEFNELANLSLKYNLKYKIKNGALLRKYIHGILLAVDKEPNLNWWDVSAVTNMTELFQQTDFNGYIDQWDVSNVIQMDQMFNACPFNRDISKWDVSNVESMEQMFAASKFNQDISMWDISSCTNFSWMFRDSLFDQDLSKWHIKRKTQYFYPFYRCPMQKKYKWHPKLIN